MKLSIDDLQKILDDSKEERKNFIEKEFISRIKNPKIRRNLKNFSEELGGIDRELYEECPPEIGASFFYMTQYYIDKSTYEIVKTRSPAILIFSESLQTSVEKLTQDETKAFVEGKMIEEEIHLTYDLSQGFEVGFILSSSILQAVKSQSVDSYLHSFFAFGINEIVGDHFKYMYLKRQGKNFVEIVKSLEEKTNKSLYEALGIDFMPRSLLLKIPRLDKKMNFSDKLMLTLTLARAQSYLISHYLLEVGKPYKVDIYKIINQKFSESVKRHVSACKRYMNIPQM